MRDRLARLVAERERVLTAFLEREKEQMALACHALARAFSRGATLVPFGVGAAATDAAHVAVEFMHPVVVGKRALPAVAQPRLARAGDIALTLAHGREQPALREFREQARARGLLTVALAGSGPAPEADFAFVVGHEDERIVQEVQETLYHVLWELVHVFFEHPGLLEETCVTCGDVAVEGVVVSVDGRSAVVERDGVRETVAVDLIEEGVAVGDALLSHAGVAIEKLGP